MVSTASPAQKCSGTTRRGKHCTTLPSGQPGSGPVERQKARAPTQARKLLQQGGDDATDTPAPTSGKRKFCAEGDEDYRLDPIDNATGPSCGPASYNLPFHLSPSKRGRGPGVRRSFQEAAASELRILRMFN